VHVARNHPKLIFAPLRLKKKSIEKMSKTVYIACIYQNLQLGGKYPNFFVRRTSLNEKIVKRLI